MRFFKPLVFAALLAALLFAGFIAFIGVIFAGRLILFPFICVALLCAALLAGAWLFGWFARTWRLLIAGLLCASVASVVGISLYKDWVASIPTVQDEVNLWDYRPFDNHGRVASLPSPASLRLSGQLPRLDGATALYPLYAAFVQATYPQDEYDPSDSIVQCSKTAQAWQRLIDGEVDMIFVARPSQKQLEAARAKGVEFVLTPIGGEAFVFFVNARNPVKGLSKAQIQDIYAGKLKRWNEVGGEDRAIRAFQRPDGSGSQTMLKKIMAAPALLPAPQEDVVQGMGGIIRQTADYRNFRDAIGYSFLFFATRMVAKQEIRLLEIDGVAPSRQSIRDKTYPFTAELYAVTLKGHGTPQVRALRDWIVSAQGQALVEKTGYVPLR